MTIGKSLLPIIVAAVAVVALIAAGGYLVRGERYRLYIDGYASHCWAALEQLTPPSSSLRPQRIAVDAGDGGERTEVVIGYRMDRVLAGLELEARCVYPGPPGRAAAIVLNGSAVEPETLEDVNRALR